MSTLSDLRTTLDEHAERVPDGEAVVRSAAVRHRISVVRRRRRTALVGVAAVVLLAGVAGITGLVGPRGDDNALPTAPTIFGVKAPTTQQALGYTYRTSGVAVTFEGAWTTQIHANAQPTLLSWTTERPTTVHVTLPDATHWTSTVSRFRDYVVIPPEVSGKVRVSVDSGRVGLTSYDLTDARPDGVTRDAITFRRTVADTPLVFAEIGATGQTDARSSFRAVDGQVRIAVLCTGAPSGTTVHVTLGRGVENDTGCGTTGFDPGSNVIGANNPGHVGADVPVRVWATRSDGTTPLSSEDAGRVRLGVGLYGPVAGAKGALGAIDRALEYGGHTWRLDTVTRPLPASSDAAIRLQPLHRETVLTVAMATQGEQPADLAIRVTGMPLEQSGFGGDGVGISGPYWVPAGAHAQVRRSPAGALVVARYVRAD